MSSTDGRLACQKEFQPVAAWLAGKGQVGQSIEVWTLGAVIVKASKCPASNTR